MRKDQLTQQLQEARLLYNNKTTAEVGRIRGNLLAGFYHTGCPAKALPLLLEELQNSRHPYLIAGAARGLRGCQRPNPSTVPYLLAAMENLGHGDDLVCFEHKGTKNYSTATTEILTTLAHYGKVALPWMAQLQAWRSSVLVTLNSEAKELLEATIAAIEKDNYSASCCEGAPVGGWSAATRWSLFKSLFTTAPKRIALQDQDGNNYSFDRYCTGKPTVVVFFYSRCDNPDKCSLTITMLARLQQLLVDKEISGQVNLAAITYDPDFDIPSRLKQYGNSRQLQFNDTCHSFRATDNFESLRQFFNLGVNYNGTVVNKHKIELYLLNPNGQLAGSSTRLQWDNDTILVQLEKLLTGKKTLCSVLAATGRNTLSGLLFVGFVFAPKCPLCLAAYLSVFGISSMKANSLAPWLLPIFVAGIAANLFIIGRVCAKRQQYFPIYLSVAGALLIAVGGYWLHSKTGSMMALGCFLLSSMLTSMPVSYLKKGWYRKGTHGTIGLLPK